MINAATFIGEPVSFLGLCWIYPPKVKDIVANQKFSTYLRILTITQEELIEENKKTGVVDEKEWIIDPFEFILNCSYNSKEFKKIAEDAFFFFTHEPVLFLYEEKKIIFGYSAMEFTKITDVAQFRILTQENYFNFQNEIRVTSGINKINTPEPFDPNEDPRIRRMKEKIRERDRIKAKAAAEGKGGNGISLSTSLAAICCMGIGLTPLNIGELSYAAITPIMSMMQEKEKYDIDIRSLLAGADSKKIKPKYWIRNSD